jgi:hypothetical protein
MARSEVADIVADVVMYIIMFGIVLVSFYIWVIKVWPTDAVPDLAGIAALVGVIPVSKAAKVYIETRARKTTG